MAAAFVLVSALLAAQGASASLFSLPTTSSEDGPVAQLPPPTTQLPRAKPLPKPKPLTKWEKFAKAKGIQKKVREKKVWDEEKQEWVDRWGWKGTKGYSLNSCGCQHDLRPPSQRSSRKRSHDELRW